jgi:hypothetical protein
MNSGMSIAGTFVGAYKIYCLRDVTGSVRVTRPVTIVSTRTNATDASSVQKLTLAAWVNSTTTIMNNNVLVVTPNTTIITQGRGLAIADPYVVAWQEKELSLFPTEYASSLA